MLPLNLLRRPACMRRGGDILDQLFTSSNGAWWVAGTRGVNIISTSNDLESGGTGWSPVNATYAESTEKLTEDATAAANHYHRYLNFPTVNGTTYTVTIEAKSAGRDWINLYTNSPSVHEVWFDLANGVVGTADDSADGTITSLGGGWYRCEKQFTSTTTASTTDLLIRLATAEGTDSYNGDGSSGVLLRNPQIEEGSAFTSYEETTGTALAGALLDGTGGGRHMTLPGGTANSVRLDHDGTNYFWFPGTSGNKITVPDSAALDITGDLEIILHVQLDDWDAAGQQSLLQKVTTAYLVQQNASNVQFGFHNGTSYNSYSFAHGLTGNEDRWLKFTLDVDNGASGHDISAYISTDGVSYSQLGTTTTVAGTISVGTNASPVTIGDGGGGAYLSGKVYRAIIKDGIDGTTVLDVNAADADPNSTTFTEASSNAATVTINRSASGYQTAVVDQPLYTPATDDYFDLDNTDSFFDVGASEDMTWGFIVRRSGDPASIAIAGISAKDGEGTGDSGWKTYLQTTGDAYAMIGDGTNRPFAVAVHPAYPYTALFSGVRDAGTTIGVGIDGSITTATDTTTGAITAPTAIRICADAGATADRFMDGGSVIGGFFLKGVALTGDQLSDMKAALITRNGGTP